MQAPQITILTSSSIKTVVYQALLHSTNLFICNSTADTSLFTKASGSHLIVLLVYVDDIIIAGPNHDLLASTKDLLEHHFKLKILGDVKYFLGLEIAKSDKGIHFCQHKYAPQLLSDTGLTTAKPATIPMDPRISLSETEGDLLPDAAEYRRLVGKLTYLTISWPDIAYYVNKLSQFMSKPCVAHLQAVQQVLRYIKGTPAQGLFFPATSNLKLFAYVDADWDSCSSSRKSTTGAYTLAKI